MGPLPALGTGEVVDPPPPPPRLGKIFPTIIPCSLDEKPNCTTDLFEIGRQRVRESARLARAIRLRRKLPEGWRNLPEPQQTPNLEESRSTTEFPKGRSGTHTPLGPSHSGQVTRGRSDRQRPLSSSGPASLHPTAATFTERKKEREQSNGGALQKTGKESKDRNPPAICLGGEGRAAPRPVVARRSWG